MPQPLKARRLAEKDADAIAEFMRAAAWDANATPDRVREWLRSAAAQNPFEPGEGPPLVGVFVGPLLVACLTSIPARFWNGREFAPGHWLKGFWVLEQYRDGLIGFLLLKEMLKHVGLAASMPAALAPRALSVALGMLDLGAVRNYIEPLRIARILRRLDSRLLELNGVSKPASMALKFARIAPVAFAAEAVVTLGITILRLPSALAARALTTQLADRLPSEVDLDSLWARARSVPGCSATRSGGYLAWRYQRDPDDRYWFASCWRSAELVGLAVVQRPERLDDARLAGLLIGSVVDLVLDPTCAGALASVLGAARRWAKSQSYDALLLTMSRLKLRAPAMRAGYIPMTGNIHLMLRDPGGQHGLSPNLDTWMVTRGDAWSDHL
jgi:GNAT superfamily N-acetyltransferase